MKNIDAYKATGNTGTSKEPYTDLMEKRLKIVVKGRTSRDKSKTGPERLPMWHITFDRIG